MPYKHINCYFSKKKYAKYRSYRGTNTLLFQELKDGDHAEPIILHPIGAVGQPFMSAFIVDDAHLECGHFQQVVVKVMEGKARVFVCTRVQTTGISRRSFLINADANRCHPPGEVALDHLLCCGRSARRKICAINVLDSSWDECCFIYPLLPGGMQPAPSKADIGPYPRPGREVVPKGRRNPLLGKLDRLQLLASKIETDLLRLQQPVRHISLMVTGESGPAETGRVASERDYVVAIRSDERGEPEKARPELLENWAKSLPLAPLLARSVMMSAGADSLEKVSCFSAEDIAQVTHGFGEDLKLILMESVDKLKQTLRKIKERKNCDSQVEKFVADVPRMKCGSIDDFHKGLAARIGILLLSEGRTCHVLR